MEKKIIKKHLWPSLLGVDQNPSSTAWGELQHLLLECLHLLSTCLCPPVCPWRKPARRHQEFGWGEGSSKAAAWSGYGNKTFQRIPRSCPFYFANTLKEDVLVTLSRNILIFFILKWLFILMGFILYCTLLNRKSITLKQNVLNG